MNVLGIIAVIVLLFIFAIPLAHIIGGLLAGVLYVVILPFVALHYVFTCLHKCLRWIKGKEPMALGRESGGVSPAQSTASGQYSVTGQRSDSAGCSRQSRP